MSQYYQSSRLHVKARYFNVESNLCKFFQDILTDNTLTSFWVDVEFRDTLYIV